MSGSHCVLLPSIHPAGYPLKSNKWFFILSLGEELVTGVCERDGGRAQEDVDIHYRAIESLGQAHADVIWKNKYETGTNNSISSSRRAYYVCTVFVLKCSGDKWLLMKRGAG